MGCGSASKEGFDWTIVISGWAVKKGVQKGGGEVMGSWVGAVDEEH